MKTSKASKATAVTPVLEGVDASLLDIVDHVLTKGVVLTGDLMLGVADVDLVYLRLSAVLCAADRLFRSSTGKKRRRESSDGAASGGRPAIAKRLGAPKLRSPRS
jgi:hypothetical protein